MCVGGGERGWWWINVCVCVRERQRHTDNDVWNKDNKENKQANKNPKEH